MTDDANEDQHREAVPENFLRPLPVSLSEIDGRHRRAAAPDEHRKCVDECQDRHKEAGPRERGRTDIRHVADINSVYNIIKKTHDLRDDGRQRELQEERPD